jgi:hypothetical protein
MYQGRRRLPFAVLPLFFAVLPLPLFKKKKRRRPWYVLILNSN